MTNVYTPATLAGMPNKPKTKVRTFRIPDDVYEAARAKAAENEESITDVVVRSLTKYAAPPRARKKSPDSE